MSPRIASFIFVICAGSFALFADFASAAPPMPHDLIVRMEAAQRDLSTLSAEFTQTSRVKLFKQEMRSQGRLLYEKTKDKTRLRWEYLRPDPSSLVMVGEEARLRMGNLPPQVFDMAKDANLRAIFSQLKLWLGLSENDKDSEKSLAADYDLRAAGDGNHPVLVLAPKSGSLMGKTFLRIELSLDSQGSKTPFALTKLLLVEQSGDEKEIVFTRVQRNAPLPPGAFDL